MISSSSNVKVNSFSKTGALFTLIVKFCTVSFVPSLIVIEISLFSISLLVGVPDNLLLFVSNDIHDG